MRYACALVKQWTTLSMGLLAQWTTRDVGRTLEKFVESRAVLCDKYGKSLSMRGKFIVLSWSSFLFSSNSWDDAANQSQRLKEWKQRLSTGQKIRGAKRRKHFTLRKFWERKGKGFRWKAKSISINSKVFWRGNGGFVDGIGHHESKTVRKVCK